MKILLVNDYTISGGAEVVFKQLYKGLKEDPSISQVRLFVGGHDEKSKPQSLLSYVYNKKIKNRFIHKVESFKPDIIHILNFYHLLSPSILHALKNVSYKPRVILTAHDYHLLSPNSGLIHYKWITNKANNIPTDKLPLSIWSAITKKWDHRGIKFSTAKIIQWIYAYRILKLQSLINTIISPSNFLKNCLKENFAHLDIHLIRNPYYKLKNTNSHSQNTYLEKSKKIRIIYAGRISHEKGLLNFLKNFPLSQSNDIILDIFGSGPEDKLLKRLLSNNSQFDFCKHYGKCSHEEILKIMPNYDVLLFPSLWYENAPLAIVEAAFAGLHLMVSDLGGSKEMALLCGKSTLFNPGITSSIGEAIQKIKENSFNTHRDKNHLKSIFDLDNFIDQHIKLYKKQ